MVIDYIEHLLVRIREHQAVYAKRLLSGSFSSLEDYKCIYGKLAGLQESEEVVKKVYKDLYETGRKEGQGNEYGVEIES